MFFGRKAEKVKGHSNDLPLASDDFEQLDCSIDRIMHTLNAEEFFDSMHNARACYVRLRSSGRIGDMHYIDSVYRQIEDTVSVTDDFLNRLCTSGRMIEQIDDIIKRRCLMPDESYGYFSRLSGLRETVYTSCGVVFEGDKIYHYLCELEGIKPGDVVAVPVGRDSEETVATVVSIGSYYRDYLPYPLNKMKKVLAVLNTGGAVNG